MCVTVEVAPHTVGRDQLINLCVYGMPLPPYIKEEERGGAGPLYGAPKGSPTPTGSRIPPFLVELGALPSSRSRREGKGKEKRRKEGAQPLPLVQFGLSLGGSATSSLSFP